MRDVREYTIGGETLRIEVSGCECRVAAARAWFELFRAQAQEHAEDHKPESTPKKHPCGCK